VQWLWDLLTKESFGVRQTLLLDMNSNDPTVVMTFNSSDSDLWPLGISLSGESAEAYITRRDEGFLAGTSRVEMTERDI
jgi:hypothetical protein